MTYLKGGGKLLFVFSVPVSSCLVFFTFDVCSLASMLLGIGRDPQKCCGKRPAGSEKEPPPWAWGLGSDLSGNQLCGTLLVNVGGESTSHAPNSSSVHWGHSSRRVLERSN